MANVEMCQAVLDQILMHPENHEQSTWIDAGNLVGQKEFDFCQTTMCVAGWAAYLDGRITWNRKSQSVKVDGRIPVEFVRNDPMLTAWLNVLSDEFVEDNTVDHAPWGVLGAYILDLSHTEASQLFDSDNETAVRCLKALANGESILDKNEQIRADLDANLT